MAGLNRKRQVLLHVVASLGLAVAVAVAIAVAIAVAAGVGVGAGDLTSRALSLSKSTRCSSGRSARGARYLPPGSQLQTSAGQALRPEPRKPRSACLPLHVCSRFCPMLGHDVMEL